MCRGVTNSLDGRRKYRQFKSPYMKVFNSDFSSALSRKRSGMGMIMKDSTTVNLAKILEKIDSSRDMEEYLEIPAVADSFQNFPDYFRSLEAVQVMDTSDLIQSSGLERSYYYQVMKGKRNPGRDKVLRLCLAAGLSLRETTRALELSGNAVLYPRRRRDIILTVAVNLMADVDDTNLLLYKYGEKPLG